MGGCTQRRRCGGVPYEHSDFSVCCVAQLMLVVPSRTSSRCVAVVRFAVVDDPSFYATAVIGLKDIVNVNR